jgi:biotin carboxyl carrier protein
LKYKYGMTETIPDDWKPPRAPKTMEEVKKDEELIARAKAGELVERSDKVPPEKGPGVRTFNVFVDGEYYEVDVESVGDSPPVAVSRPADFVAPSPAPSAAVEEPPKVEEKKTAPPEFAEGTMVLAPMPGMIIRYVVNAGDEVRAGDTLLVLEAMKMQNVIPAPVDGVVRAIDFGPGDSVEKNDVLAVIS